MKLSLYEQQRLRAAIIAVRENYDVHVGCGGEISNTGRCALCRTYLTSHEMMYPDTAREVLVHAAEKLLEDYLELEDRLARIVSIAKGDS